MSSPNLERLRAIPRLRIERNPLLSHYTRFAIGGPAALPASLELMCGGVIIG
jgi:hypothetical protein